ncbi:ADP-ribosylglycohydrolase family protein [Paraferrimonas sp. SM1919]|uniref:ADP-ribosylglycohydrolase family protein n=1 Tax=Paraferrimonas sp. SM1919 TaxID=2662263 RepID=UPI0013CF51B3|nr:ADP-ribosylglycohydrolase family protein [Paraferrimonas sp. SM1919]
MINKISKLVIGALFTGGLFSPLVFASNSAVEDNLAQDKTISLQDRFHGFWLGQSIANWTGLVTEMDKVGTPETLPFYTSSDWGKYDRPNMWGNYAPHSNKIAFYFGELDQPWGSDDDTDIEYIYTHLMAKTAPLLPTAKQITDAWLAHIYTEEEAPLYRQFPHQPLQRENFLWASNQKAFKLMQQGVQPPQTSDPKLNSDFDKIDAQLTTEIFGLFAFGKPELALKLAKLPISVSASGDAADMAKFYVLMHSYLGLLPANLTLQQQSLWLAQQARAHFNDASLTAQMYDLVHQSYQTNPNKDYWEVSRDLVHQKYQLTKTHGYQYQSPFDAGINFAASLVSWFYGQGDYLQTVKIATLAGWDSDNPAATWGGLLGALHGQDELKKLFPHVTNDCYKISRTRKNFSEEIVEFHKLAAKSADIALKFKGK